MNNATNGNGRELEKPIAIYYEHPDWFRPLFQQMDERGANWLKIEARHHYYDVGLPELEYSLLFNRMSPSAWQRGLGHEIFYTLNYLAHRSEEHTSELQSPCNLVCRLLLEKKKKKRGKEPKTSADTIHPIHAASHVT